MKDLGIFCLPGDGSAVSVVENNKEYYNHTYTKSKIEELGITYDFIECGPSQIPRTVDYKLVMIIDRSLYFAPDFIFNAISLANLYQGVGAFFSPTNISNVDENKHQYLVDEYYHHYEIDLSDSVCSDITLEPHNFGSIVGSIISGRAFNEAGYSCTTTPRGESIENSLFIHRVSKKHKIYYAKNLKKIKRISESDYSPECISNYYYHMGYQEGLRMSSLSDVMRSAEFKRKFIESPELLDHKQPKWLFEEYTDKTSPYIETLVMLKCKYSIGFFEGITGKKII